MENGKQLPAERKMNRSALLRGLINRSLCPEHDYTKNREETTVQKKND